MPNIKQQKKRVLTNEKRRLRNIAVRSRMKTYVKSAEEAIASKDSDKIKSSLPEALSEIDRAAGKGVLHRNSAARKKAHLQRIANAVLKA